MNNKAISLLVAGLSGIAFCTPASAGYINPNDPALAPFTQLYGDFNVISLQFADTALNTKNYYIASGPGQIRPDVVIGTGAGGTFYNDGSAPNANAMDMPYATPNHAKGITYFETGNAISALDPGGAGQFYGDQANTWDANISQFNAALGGSPAVFYFNLNETGTTNQLIGTDLQMWAEVRLTGTGVTPVNFYLAGNYNDGGAGVTASILNGAPDAVPTPGGAYDPSDPRWTYVHGDICVNGSTFLHYGSCTSSDVGAQTINQDLGANQAAFAAYNMKLDNLIQHPCLSSGACYDTLHINWRMASLDNGYEQLFVASTASQEVPEPATILLFGTGLLGLGILGHFKRYKKAA